MPTPAEWSATYEEMRHYLKTVNTQVERLYTERNTLMQRIQVLEDELKRAQPSCSEGASR